MSIQMVGVDHSIAPVDIREKFSFTTAAAKAAMCEICKTENVTGCVILSTCNRTEIWISYNYYMPRSLKEIFCELKGLEAEKYSGYLVMRENYMAVSYLFEMTSGLKSMILGEDQILAQVKKAQELARENGTCDNVLEVLFRSAVTGAKKVKTELILSTANASAVELAINRLRDSGVDFSDKKCLVIGNGEMGKRAANALRSSGADVTVTVRQYRSGVVEIPKDCERINYGERYGLIPFCDIVVSATSSPNVTIKKEELISCGVKPGAVFIDLAVPRDIEPEVREIDGITLYDIDDFPAMETEKLHDELKEAQEMLQKQKEKFLAWYECRDLVSAMDGLGSYFAKEMKFRMEKTIKSYGIRDEEFEDFTHALEVTSGKILKKLVFAVRDEAGVEPFRECVESMLKVTGNE